MYWYNQVVLVQPSCTGTTKLYWYNQPSTTKITNELIPTHNLFNQRNKTALGKTTTKDSAQTQDPVFQKMLTPATGPKKTQNPAGDDSGTPDPWQPLVAKCTWKRDIAWIQQIR